MSNTWSVSLAPEASSEVESAGGNEVVGAPQIGDDGSVHGALDAFVLDHLDVGALAKLLDAEEHGALPNTAPLHPTRDP
jgi:hypothetical protein